MNLPEITEALKQNFAEAIINEQLAYNETTLVIQAESLLPICTALRDVYQFEQLSDLAGIDYSAFGVDEWETGTATYEGFSRGVDRNAWQTHIGSRFALTYQLLSYQHNLRLRLKVFLHDEWPEVESVTSIWPGANWFEREAFDLFGIIFRNHPDLRRILTDYGFIGHPFRKDFPMIGEVEMRYDANQNRVIYGEVEIQNRTLVPKVIRHDNRYLEK